MNELRRIVTADGHIDAVNPSNNPSFHNVLEARLSRRQALIGGLSASAYTLMASAGLVACSDDDDDNTGGGTTPLALGFTAVAKSLADTVVVPTGYTAAPLYRLGDPIMAGVAAYKNDGTDTDFDKRAGDHHDGMYYFGLAATGNTPDRNSSTRGLLVMNHENITRAFLHPVGTTFAAPRPEADARKEINAHGVAVVEVAKGATTFAVVQGSALNRRITPFTEMDLTGPVAGSNWVKTKFSTDGTKTRGTINNCANGYTPWGTYLTCEENWPGYFKRPTASDALRTPAEIAQLNRFGVVSTTGSNLWATVVPADPSDTSFARWDISPTGGAPTDDFRNEVNTYGYIVEIDPYNATSRPKKRTALGRFSHEGAWPAAPVVGQPVVFYMGDDNRGDYVYKFVSTQNWVAADANATDRLAIGDKYLNDGTLYVATFKADGTGEWKALKFGSNGLDATATPFPFTSQADVSVATRLAADKVGATKMDRPEWAAVHPTNGEVYLTLTNSNNGNRPTTAVDAANPRSYDGAGNPNGHIIRWKEDGGSAAATTFKWDVYLFGSPSDKDANNINISKLTADNDLSSPDGLWFSPASKLLWIQTDDGAYTNVTNCMMLAAAPGKQGDGASKVVTSGGNTVTTYVGKEPGADLRRFLVGPKGCEITGIAETPDGKTLFVNIQHPGEDTTGPTTNPFSLANPATYESHWPDNGTARPRSATIVITKNDGGVIGL